MKKSALLIVLVCALAMLGAQKPWDQEFKPDVDAPDGFRANRPSYSLPAPPRVEKRIRGKEKEDHGESLGDVKLAMEGGFGAFPVS